MFSTILTIVLISIILETTKDIPYKYLKILEIKRMYSYRTIQIEKWCLFKNCYENILINVPVQSEIFKQLF